MAHGSEATCLPCLHEALDPRPTVKRNAKAVGLQEATKLAEAWTKPGVGIVVEATAPVARFVADEIRRVGDDEVNAFRGHRLHDGNAIAVDDLVDERINGIQE